MFSIHRLDNDVCGLLLSTDKIEIQQEYLEIIKNRNVTKMYVGEIFGKLDSNITKVDYNILYDKNNIKSHINKRGKTAVTYIYKLSEKKHDNFSEQTITKAVFSMNYGKKLH